MVTDKDSYRAAESRIEHMILVFGLVAAVWTGAALGVAHGLGVGIGAALGWLNFRWLRKGVYLMSQVSSAQTGQAEVRIPKRVYGRFYGQFALLVAIACVIVWYSVVPPAALLGGFFVLVGAVLAESVYQLVRGQSGNPIG